MTTRVRPARAPAQAAALAGGALTGLVGTGTHQVALLLAVVTAVLVGVAVLRPGRRR